MNARQAKKIRSQRVPPDIRPGDYGPYSTAQVIRASVVYRRALRRWDGVQIKWGVRRPHHTTTRETRAEMMARLRGLAASLPVTP
jgi:hypothetical protein